MIQDQCNKCFKQGTASCTENIVFDSTSCPNYGQKINLDKKEDVVNPLVSESESELDSNANCPDSNAETFNEQTFVYTKEYLKQNTKIRGWLAFFLFTIILGGFVSFIYPIVTFQENSGSFFFPIADIVQGSMLFGLACYTLYSFINRETNAVFLAKTYLVIIFFINLFLVIIGGYEQNGVGSLPQLLRSLIWAFIWFIFLHQSTVVKEVIPEEYRKAKLFDYYAIAAIIVIPLLLIAFGLKDIYSSQEEQQQFIEKTALNANEYTDGRIIFECLEDFTCEKEDIQDPQITIYRLENDSIASITVCSDYDTDITQSNFNSYCENWEDESSKAYESTITENRPGVINGHKYFIQTKKYIVNTYEVYWRFVLLFDQSSGKVALVSSYDGGYDEYLKPFLYSIRFK